MDTKVFILYMLHILQNKKGQRALPGQTNPLTIYKPKLACELSAWDRHNYSYILTLTLDIEIVKYKSQYIEM